MKRIHVGVETIARGRALQPGVGKRERHVGWVILFSALRGLGLAAPITGTFVVVTALASAGVESERWRLFLGVAVCAVFPGLLYARAAAFLRARTRPRVPR